jgi:hypothetical protein
MQDAGNGKAVSNTLSCDGLPGAADAAVAPHWTVTVPAPIVQLLFSSVSDTTSW